MTNVDSNFRSIDEHHLRNIVKWSDKFGDSYSRYRGEGGSLSPSLSIRNAVEKFPNQQSLDASISQLSISTDDWRQRMVTVAWRLRRMNDAPLLARHYFRFGNSSRVSGALQVVQRPAWQELLFTTSNLASTIIGLLIWRVIDGGATQTHAYDEDDVVQCRVVLVSRRRLRTLGLHLKLTLNDFKLA